VIAARVKVLIFCAVLPRLGLITKIKTVWVREWDSVLKAEIIKT